MTLLPSSEFGIRGHPGNPYDVNAICAQPFCRERSRHVHHCWPRSFLRGQPYEWVWLPEGVVIGNRLGFCVTHHEDLTGPVGGHRAALVWDAGVMWWEEKLTTIDGKPSWQRVEMLKAQPPVAGTHIAPVVHDHSNGDAQCPLCGHVARRPRREEPKPGKLRPVKAWTVNVPDDAEIGADVLDDLIEDLAIPLEMSDYTSRLKRYHVLTVVLAWAVQNRQLLIADVAEAAERQLAS